MPVTCHVVAPDGVAADFDFNEVPRTGDYVFLPGPDGQPPEYFRVDRVVFAPVGFATQDVELFISPES